MVSFVYLSVNGRQGLNSEQRAFAVEDYFSNDSRRAFWNYLNIVQLGPG